MTWAFIAHKDGFLAGVIVGDATKAELKKFCGNFVADGFDITSVKDRDEYLAKIKTMPAWRHSPEWRAKHPSSPATHQPKTGE